MLGILELSGSVTFVQLVFCVLSL